MEAVEFDVVVPAAAAPAAEERDLVLPDQGVGHYTSKQSSLIVSNIWRLLVRRWIVRRPSHMIRRATTQLKLMTKAIQFIVVSKMAILQLVDHQEEKTGYQPLLNGKLTLFKAVNLLPDHFHFLHLPSNCKLFVSIQSQTSRQHYA